MKAPEHRLQKIRAHVQDAREELDALPAKDKQAFKNELARLEEVVARAGAVLSAADPRLVSTRAFASIQSAACSISNDPRAALQAADAHGNTLEAAVALLPVTRQELEQHVSTAADSFHKSAGDRLDALRGEIESEAERLRSLGSEIEQWKSHLDGHVDRQAVVDKKLAEAEKAIARTAAESSEQLARQGEAFTESERSRADRFQAQLDAFRSELDAFRSELSRAQQDAIDEAQARVAEIRRMEEETAELVGAIGLQGTAEVYRRQGRRDRRAAEILRGLAVLAGLGAVAIALAGVVVTNATVESLAAGAFASLLLAGLAAYLARQSGRHRAQEERASAVQLELAAFGPFIEPLSPEQREEERVIMARKLFPAPDRDAAPVSLALWRGREDAGRGESNGGPERLTLAPRPDSEPADAGLAPTANGSRTH